MILPIFYGNEVGLSRKVTAVEGITITGLLPGFHWIVNGSFVEILLMFWLISPGIHLLVGLILEGRLVPLGQAQFDSFFPGDILLGTAGACFWWNIQKHMEPAEHWLQSRGAHLFIIAVLLVVGIVQMYLEFKQGTYPQRAVLSPTKIWHNVALYVLLGYPVAVGLFAQFPLMQDTHFRKFFIFGLLCFLCWVTLMVKDTLKPDLDAIAGAHVDNWAPIWVRLHNYGFTWWDFWQGSPRMNRP